MSRLLSANFARLGKNRLFWVALALTAALSVYVAIQYILLTEEWNAAGETLHFETGYFTLAPFIGLPITLVIIFFLGTDYSDGTIRNKITAGHTRTEIYCANLITCVFISSLIDIVWLVFGLIGLPFMECGQGIGQMLLYASVSLLFSISTGAIVALVGMLISGRAGAVAISVILYFGFLIDASPIIMRLDEPEMHSYMEMTAEGMQIVGPIANPQYVGGTLRVVYEFIVNTLAAGQAIMLSNLELEHPVFDLVVSAF
ncbi:MAG: ABC transporter permease, partial [Oscillospiraceae bacterium]|nr:ABC transporter permease [Oscillospiraceae bacterium]